MQSHTPFQIASDDNLNRAGRRARDAQIRQGGYGDNAWDQLSQIYTECLAMVAHPSDLVGLLRDKNALNAVQDTQTLVANYQILARDLSSYLEQLKEIRKEHSGLAGSANEGGALLECIQIGEKYQEWMAQFQMVVLPTVNAITSQVYPDMGQPTAQTGEYIPATAQSQH